MLRADEDARQNDVDGHNARDDNGQCARREIRLNGTLRAQETGRTGAAAGLQVVRAIRRERARSTEEARAINGVASRAAAGATVACAKETSGSTRRWLGNS